MSQQYCNSVAYHQIWCYNARSVDVINTKGATMSGVDDTRGRIPGIYLAADEAYAIACRGFNYWWKADEDGQFAVWQGERFIRIVGRFTLVRRVIVEDFRSMLTSYAGGNNGN